MFDLSIDKPILDQDFYFMGMKHTLATFSIVMENLTPAMTFALALIIR